MSVRWARPVVQVGEHEEPVLDEGSGGSSKGGLVLDEGSGGPGSGNRGMVLDEGFGGSDKVEMVTDGEFGGSDVEMVIDGGLGGPGSGEGGLVPSIACGPMASGSEILALVSHLSPCHEMLHTYPTPPS